MIRGSAILNLRQYEKGFRDGDVSGAFFFPFVCSWLELARDGR